MARKSKEKSRQVRENAARRGHKSPPQPAARSRGFLAAAAVLLAIAGLAIQQLFLAQSGPVVAERSTDEGVRTVQEQAESPAVAASGERIPNPDLSHLQASNADRIRSARAAVIANPNSTGSWAQLGASCDAYGIHGCAAAGYRRAYELAPSDLRWLYLHAIARLDEGAASSEVLPFFEHVAAGMPRFAPVLYRIGQVLEMEGKLASARDSYLRAVGISPTDPIYHFAAGKVILAMHDAKLATQYLLAAAQFAPHDGPVRATLAEAFRQTGETDRAEEVAAEGQSLGTTLELDDPVRAAALEHASSVRAVFARASSLVSEGKYVDAIAVLEEIGKTHSADPLVQIRLAYAHLKNDNIAESKTHLEKGLRLRAAAVEDEANSAGLTEKLGRIDAATVAYWTEYLTVIVKKNDADALDRCLAEFAAAAPNLPLHATAFASWGNALRQAGRPGEAIERYVDAIAKEPRFVNAYHNAALILEDFGHVEQAMAYYERAATLLPGGPSAARLAVLKKAQPAAIAPPQSLNDQE